MRPVADPPSPGRPTRLRTAGFAASVTLAVSAYRAGALPAGAAEAAPVPDTWDHWLGLAGWFAGLAALTVVWWRLGVRIRHRPESVPLGWLLRTGLLWAAPLLVVPPVGSRDAYAYACQGALWLDGVDPYAVGVLPGGCVWSAAVPALWQDTPTPYGPLAVALAGGAVAVARAVTTATDGQLLIAIALLRAEALAGVLLAAGCLPRLARAGGVDPVRASWLGLVTPLVGVHALGGAHNDALVLGLVLAALSLAVAGPSTAGPDRVGPDRVSPGRVSPGRVSPGRVGLSRGLSRFGLNRGLGRFDLSRGLSRFDLSRGLSRFDLGRIGLGAGALLGLAVAIKVTAIVALPFALLLAAARPDSAPTSGALPKRRPVSLTPAVAVAVAGGSVGAGLAFAGVTLATGLDLGWISALSGTGRLVQWTSVPTGLGMAAGYLLRLAGYPETIDAAVAAARLLGLVALAGTLAVLLARAWRAVRAADRTSTRRRLVTITGIAFTALALLSPIFYPWYGLVAVAVLAAGLTAWHWVHRVALAVIVLGFLVLPGGLGLAVLTKLPGALLDVTLVAVLAPLAYRRWRAGVGHARSGK